MDIESADLLSNKIASGNAIILDKSCVNINVFEQRKATAIDILTREPSLFLEKFGPTLDDNDLSMFDTLKDDYEVAFYLNRLKSKDTESTPSFHIIRNRRYKYMLDHIDDNYFSEDAMKQRDPLLHYNLIGKYEKPGVRKAYLQNREIPLYEKLIKAEIDHEDELKRKEQSRIDFELLENEDSLEDSLNASKDTPEMIEENNKEFFKIMKARFINGEDAEFFNYDDIETNIQYDLSKEMEQDEEDIFFEEL